MPGKSTEKYQYDAFISYSREDEGFARELQVRLEKNFKKIPKKFKGKKKRIEIIRDATDLEINPDLWGEIKSKLSQSRCLIVICSPSATSRSVWVSREIEAFLLKDSAENAQRRKQIIPLLVSADKDNLAGSFPELLKVSGELPLAVEFRKTVIEKSQKYEKYFDNEGLNRVYSKILGVEYRKFAERQERYQRQRLRITIAVVGAIAVAFALLSVFALVQMNKAIEQRDVADSRRLATLSDNRLAKNTDEALLLAAKAYEIGSTYEARKSLWNITQRLSNLLTTVHFPERRIFDIEPIDTGRIAIATDMGLYAVDMQSFSHTPLFEADTSLVSLSLAYCKQINSMAVIKGRSILIYRMDNKHPPIELKIEKGDTQEEFFELAISPDGTYVTGATNGGGLFTWSLSKDSLVDMFYVSSPHALIENLVFMPSESGQLLFTVENLSFIRNITTHTYISTPLAHEAGIQGIKYSDPYWVSHDTQGWLNIWVQEDEKLALVSRKKLHENVMAALDINSFNKQLFSIGMLDEQFKVWSFPELDLVDSFSVVNGTLGKGTYVPNTDIIAVSAYGKVTFWRPDTNLFKSVQLSMKGFDSQNPFYVDVFGEYIYYLGEDNVLNIYEVKTKKSNEFLLPNHNPLYPGNDTSLVDILKAQLVAQVICASPQRDKVAIASNSKIIIYTLPGLKVEKEIMIDEDEVEELTFSPSGNQLAYLQAGKVHIRSLNTENETVIDKYADSGVSGISFLGENKLNLIAWHPIQWDINAAREIGPQLEEFETNPAFAFTVSPDKSIGAVGYDFEGSLRLWSLSNKENFDYPLEYHSGILRFSENGKYLIEFDAETQTLHKHLIDFEYLHKRSQEMVGRQLGEQEYINFGIRK